MVRSELIELLAAENPDVAARDVETVISTFFSTITDHLANQGRAELRGFGVFSIRARDARVGRNPRTGGAVAVPPYCSSQRSPHNSIRQSNDEARP